MKNLLLTVLCLCLSTTTIAQNDKYTDQERYGKGKMPFNEKGQVVFTKIVNENGNNKDVIYSAAKISLTEMFNSAKDVIQLDDSDAGIIIIKAFTEEPSRGVWGTVQNAEVWFTLKLQAKDGRYKIDIYQIKGHASAAVVNGTYCPEVNMPAETLTCDLCFKPNGKMKTVGEGFYRRAIIDGCNRLLLQVEKSIHDNLTTDSVNNTEDW